MIPVLSSSGAPELMESKLSEKELRPSLEKSCDPDLSSGNMSSPWPSPSERSWINGTRVSCLNCPHSEQPSLCPHLLGFWDDPPRFPGSPFPRPPSLPGGMLAGGRFPGARSPVGVVPGGDVWSGSLIEASSSNSVSVESQGLSPMLRESPEPSTSP